MKNILIVLHLLASMIWVGGHIVLSIVVLPRVLSERDPDQLHAFESRYERIGIPALIVQVISGVWLAYIWLPSFSAWFAFDNPASHHIVAKLVLLAATIVLAAHARLKLIPNLTVDTLRPLAAHIITVTIVGILFVLVGVSLRVGGLV